MICGGFAWAYADDTGAGHEMDHSRALTHVWLGFGQGRPGRSHCEGYGDGDGRNVGPAFTEVRS